MTTPERPQHPSTPSEDVRLEHDDQARWLVVDGEPMALMWCPWCQQWRASVDHEPCVPF